MTDPVKLAEKAATRVWVSLRDEALRRLDMDWARDMMPFASSDEVRLIAMHKARYEAVNIEPALRMESRDWLRQRGYGRFDGLPWPADDRQLPA